MFTSNMHACQLPTQDDDDEAPALHAAPWLAHIFSRFSAPLMLAGSSMVFTATTEPRQRPLYTCVVVEGSFVRQSRVQPQPQITPPSGSCKQGCNCAKLCCRLASAGENTVRTHTKDTPTYKVDFMTTTHLAKGALSQQVDGLYALHVLCACVAVDCQLPTHVFNAVCAVAVNQSITNEGISKRVRQRQA